MDPTIILFAVFLFLMLMNVPIALCLGVSSIVGIIVMGVPLSVVPMQVYAGIGKATLLAIPFFILAGVIMDRSGISKRLINLADALVGHKTGGLAIVCVIVSCFFAAIFRISLYNFICNCNPCNFIFHEKGIASADQRHDTT